MKRYKAAQEDYKKGLSATESLLISALARQDKKIFSIEDARALTQGDPKKIMSSLIRKKWLLPLRRGLYAIVPLDVGVKGADSFILHNFVIASHLVEPYYIAYWSALNHHGLSEQIPRTTFIATTKPKMPLTILDSDYRFVTIDKRKFFGSQEIEIEGWKVNISSPEKTIADALDHPEHSGGIDEVAKAIYFNHKELDIARVRDFAIRMGNLTILKRLGYILDVAGLLETYKDVFRNFTSSKGYPALDPISSKKGTYNSRWGLLLNFELDPKRWRCGERRENRLGKDKVACREEEVS
jgi:predicted transcriptional regulator of viral defense system